MNPEVAPGLDAYTHDRQALFAALLWSQLATVAIKLILTGNLEIDVRLFGQPATHFRVITTYWENSAVSSI